MKIKNVNLDICKAKAGIRTDTELSKRTGISRTTIIGYRNKDKFCSITLKNLMFLCSILNCKLEDLVEFEY
ncbi:helix-turn-helix transcriptional regulator [Clostridium felsineum]|uniref:helix-turn-helix domain-containing protein n=1 Tax=Clostridium felsineum TaxID=36839 RepID=UPI00214D8F12|nr:helix-turn-helix transcriptional regulator [Clostridium felsineum]MCR3760439.1 helix-turn-helix transcriptional regulator [Clostridium felsineum]